MSTIWFVDTCSLINMEASPNLGGTIRAGLQGQTVIVLDVVVNELNNPAPEVAHWAQAAVSNLAWTQTWNLNQYADATDVEYWQLQVADGRPLAYPLQHWAEAGILAVVEALDPKYKAVLLLSDDNMARDKAAEAGCEEGKSPYATAVSSVRYLYERVQRGTLLAADALLMAEDLHKAKRCPEFDLADFTAATPAGLGNWGRPW